MTAIIKVLDALSGTGKSSKCPACHEVFERKRANQKYCGRKCQRNAAAKGKRTVAASKTQRRICETDKEVYGSLTISFYETPPKYRAEFMERLISEGRRLAKVQRILKKRVPFWHYSYRGMLPIQQVFYHYCQEVYGMKVSAVLNRNTVLPSDPCYPCEYLGPDGGAVYSDGTLNKRSISEWRSVRGQILAKLSTGRPYDWSFVQKALSEKVATDDCSEAVIEFEGDEVAEEAVFLEAA